MVFKILVWSFVLVMIFRFVVRFVLPILRITRSAQDKIRQMQQQMNDMHSQTQKQPEKGSQLKDGDYIEYEEVK
ncbi:MAG: hypothetical protein EOO04_17260 [Chitinophagaceae bacterium]|nr:MAG: hypothetical protein EOO04_17260 [Chitinophagaceae bacterium]